jgi:hypothetical protein
VIVVHLARECAARFDVVEQVELFGINVDILTVNGNPLVGQDPVVARSESIVADIDLVTNVRLKGSVAS